MPAPPAFIAATRDVTERKQAEAEIEKLARFPGENPNPVLRVLRDGILVYANRASASLLSAWACQVGQRLPDPWLQFVRTASGSGSSHTAEANIADRVLSLTFAPVAAEYVNVYGLDITARKHAEAALRENEAKLQSIFRATPSGIGVVVHRVLKAANQRLCEMVGYAEDELVNQSARLLYPTDEEFAYVGREKYAQIEATGVGTVETRWRRKDGTLLDVLLSSAPMEPDNWGAGVIFTALDITDRTRAAEERQRARGADAARAEAGEPGRAGGRHRARLQQPADGHPGQRRPGAAGRCPPASPARQHLQEIERASRRAADLCRQMLAYSGKGRFVVERHDLSELVREMAHLLEVSVSKRATVEYRFASDLPAVEADATQMRQVVMNLITNASEAIGDRRRHHHRHHRGAEFDRAYLVESLLGADLAGGDYVYLEVADTGCGMDAATRERIFDPFFTTKFTGRGLGLAAVLGIVRGHGGAIRVQSAPAQGSTFSVLFPASPASPGRQRAAPARTWTGRGRARCCWWTTRRRCGPSATRMLERSGFQVLTAADGDEALEVYPPARRRHRLRAPRPDHAGPERRRDVRRAASRERRCPGGSLQRLRCGRDRAPIRRPRPGRLHPEAVHDGGVAGYPSARACLTVPRRPRDHTLVAEGTPWRTVFRSGLGIPLLRCRIALQPPRVAGIGDIPRAHTVIA